MSNNKRTYNKIHTLGEILKTPTPIPDILFGGWLASKTCTMIHAAAGAGKSWFAMGIALAVCGGGKIVNWEGAGKKNVLYVDGEMNEYSYKKRLTALINRMSFDDRGFLNDNFFFRSSEYAVRIDSVQAYSYYSRFIKENNIELIIFDNIRTLASISDENSSSAWQKVNDFLVKIRKCCAVIVVHHDSKNNNYSGSTNAITVLDNQIGLTNLKYNECLCRNLRDAGVKFGVSFNKQRDSFQMVQQDTLGFNDEIGWIDNTTRATKTSIDLTETAALAASGDFTTWKELYEHLGISEEGLRQRKIKYRSMTGSKMKLHKRKSKSLQNSKNNNANIGNFLKLV